MSDIEWPAAPPIESEERPPPPPEERRTPVAAPWTRVGAAALELVLIACTFGFGWVGWWIISWADGQSPAKRVLHLHVVRATDGRVASFGQMAVREAACRAPVGLAALAGVYLRQPWLVAVAVLCLIVAAAMALRDTRRRALWDWLAGTVVVEGDPPHMAPSPVEAGTAPS